MLNLYCESESPEGIYDLEVLSISYIRYNWNFSEAQACLILSNSLSEISYLSVLHTSCTLFTCTCSSDIGLLDIPFQHAKLVSALQIFHWVFLCPGALPIPPFSPISSWLIFCPFSGLYSNVTFSEMSLFETTQYIMATSPFLLLLSFILTLLIFFHSKHLWLFLSATI